MVYEVGVLSVHVRVIFLSGCVSSLDRNVLLQEVKVKQDEEFIRSAISDNSPESHQADLNRCTHPWEPLKRPSRKTDEDTKAAVNSQTRVASALFFTHV